MATITSAQTGNFSDTATWVGGVVPGAADDAVAATGHVVTIDTNVTVISVQQAGTGKFVLGNGRTLTGNVIANAGTFTSGGTVEVTATTGNIATITGNLSGVLSTTSNIAAVVITGTGTLTVNGSVTASNGSNTSAATASSIIYTNVNCGLNINGPLLPGNGSFKWNVRAGSSSTIVLNITGNITSGTSNSASVVLSGPSSIINIIGNMSVGTDSVCVSIDNSSAVMTLTGNASAGVGNNANCILFNSQNGQLNITGDVTGGITGTGRGVNSGVTGLSITVVGNVRGGTGLAGNGIFLNSNASGATISVTGQAIGGSGLEAHGIHNQSGNVTTTVVGTIQGGTNASHGVRNESTTTNTGVILQGNLIDGATAAVAVNTRIFRMTATNSGYTQYQNNVNYPLGSPVYRVSPDQVIGMPAASNVRKNTVYGYSNQLTGTCAIPPANAVTAGAAVDNTTGTAVLTPGDVAALVGAQVAAATTTPVVN